jgi:lipid II:glycine glycyltransferase (peptidoglycan interpeptide bridge formation enzyme)
VLDLTGGPDTIFNDRFSADVRRAVRKALRSGIELRCGTGPELLRDYRSLFELSVERWAAAQHEPLALARLRAHRRDPQTKLAGLAARFPDRVRIWIAYEDNHPVAGIVVLLASAASYTRGAMDRSRITASSANEILHWHAIQEACAAGCLTYHLGESGQSASLGRFKEKLGARAVHYAERRFEKLPLTRADVLARTVVKRAIGFRDA